MGRNRTRPLLASLATQTQLEVFEQQMDMANHLGLPVIVHSREANDEVLRVLKKRGGSGKGVIHCFSGNYDMAMAFIDIGYLISIPGTVTYKNASVTQDVARKVPLERLLVETDALSLLRSLQGETK